LDQALERLLENAAPLAGRETLPLLSCLGRYAGAGITASLDIPPFDNAPLDGFALFHGDLEGAGENTPARLKVVSARYAGDPPAKALKRGECVRIMTGAAMPEGADCVAPYEATDNGEEYVKVPFSLKAYQNYRRKGEDIKAGQQLLAQGDCIGPGSIAALASQGAASLAVYPRVKVGILSTGSELVLSSEALGGGALPAGKLYDSNRALLGGRILELGAEPCFAPAAPDDAAALAALAERLLAQCHGLITTGGVSVGDRDFMPEVGKRLHAEALFRGIAMKPGGWATAFLAGGKIMLCLSGNPGAASMTFDLLGAPLIRRLGGASAVRPVWRPVVLKTPPPVKAGGTSRYMYALDEGDGARLITGGFHGAQAGADTIIHIGAGAACLGARRLGAFFAPQRDF
jgi:molybdopterin molybdotransferase